MAKKNKSSEFEIVVGTDFHWRPSNDVYGRAVEDTLGKLLRRLKSIGGKVFIFEGDFFHNLKISIKDLLRLQRFFAKIVSFGYEVYIFNGNHDTGLDDSPLTLCAKLQGVNYIDKISSDTFVDGNNKLRFIFIPFFKKSGTKTFDEEIYEAVEPEIEQAKKKNEKVILFGHYQIGSPKIREDYRYKNLHTELPYIDGVDLYCLGHIHLHQSYKIKKAIVVYPGSISKVNFGEKDYKNGFLKIKSNLSWEFEEIESRELVEIIVKEDISETEIKKKYAGKIVKLYIETDEIDLKRLKVKFEKHCLVANIVRKKKNSKRIKSVKDINASRYDPVNALKGALDKMEMTDKKKNKVFAIGKEIIAEALK